MHIDIHKKYMYSYSAGQAMHVLQGITVIDVLKGNIAAVKLLASESNIFIASV